MKKLFSLVVLTAMVVTYSFAGNPPDAVQKAFQSKFPNATNVKWSKQSDNLYEATFEMNGTKMMTDYSSNGAWMETETSIDVNALPSSITSSVKKTYPDWKINESEKVMTSKNETEYKVGISSGMKKKELRLKEDGSIVS